MDTNGWYALLAAIIAWLIAQTWKTIRGLTGKNRPENLSFGAFVDYATRSGGMPSGHSALVSAFTTYMGMTLGVDSSIFALSLLLAIIVVYDAVHVRYAVGIQGKALNEILEKDGKKPLKVVEGHTIPQALVGIIIGIITGVIIAALV